MTTAEEWVSDRVFYGTGGAYRISAERLYDGAAAVASRRKADSAASLDRLAVLASTLKRVRRSAELEHWDWKRSPTPERLAAVRAAQAAIGPARDELLEACQNDEQVYTDVCIRFGLSPALRSEGDSRAVAAWLASRQLPAPGAPRTEAAGSAIEQARRRLADIQRRRRLIASVRAQESRSGGVYR